MAASTSLEFYFTIDPGARPAPKPLLFHHIPGATGLSFRNAAERHFKAAGSGRMEIPKGKAALKAAGDWPGGFLATFARLDEETGLAAVLSQHTSELQDATAAPILAIMEEPVGFFENRVAVRAAEIIRQCANGMAIETLLVEYDLANPQARSLANAKIPPRQPETAAEQAEWAERADALVARYRIFPASSYGAFAHYCREEYGLDDVGEPDGQKRPQAVADTAIAAVREALGAIDPVWFDRLIYERIAAR